MSINYELIFNEKLAVMARIKMINVDFNSRLMVSAHTLRTTKINNSFSAEAAQFLSHKFNGIDRKMIEKWFRI